jgi:hypothetical protein
MLKLILLSIVLIAIAFAGFAVKMFLIKGGEFKKQCSSVDPLTGKRIGCTCGNEGESTCNNSR